MNSTDPRRQSLVTAIDWKLLNSAGSLLVKRGRQSLVTPIDWKPHLGQELLEFRVVCCQSLVTPIDWKNW